MTLSGEKLLLFEFFIKRQGAMLGTLVPKSKEPIFIGIRKPESYFQTI